MVGDGGGGAEGEGMAATRVVRERAGGVADVLGDVGCG